jgi:hypothetical protein
MLSNPAQEYDITKVRVGMSIYANDSWWHILMIRKVEERNPGTFEFTCVAIFKGKTKFCIDVPKVWIKKDY